MPSFYWIFGPNGSGKSTFALDVNNGAEHVNTDSILLALVEKDAPGLINKLKADPDNTTLHENFLTICGNNITGASAEAFNSARHLIIENKDLSFENNFLPKARNEIIALAKEKNYDINFIYFASPSVDACLERVRTRTTYTGQYVSDVQRRYTQGLADINNMLGDCGSINEIKIYTTFAEQTGNARLLIQIEKGKVSISNKELKEYIPIMPGLKIFTKEKGRGM